MRPPYPVASLPPQSNIIPTILRLSVLPSFGFLSPVCEMGEKRTPEVKKDLRVCETGPKRTREST